MVHPEGLTKVALVLEGIVEGGNEPRVALFIPLGYPQMVVL